MEPPLQPPRHRRLPDARRAALHRRHLFHPRRGWFRQLERNAAILLSRHVYPRIPFLPVIYDRQLERQLTLSETEVTIADLPGPFEGLRILLLTDLHAGPFVSARSLVHSCARLSLCQPDVVLVGGDIVTADLSELAPNRAVLESLGAALGVFGVLGNHDHYTRAGDTVRAELQRAGVRVLHNTSVALERGGARLYLAGVDDMNTGTPDLPAALRGTEGPVVLLSHNPDLFFQAADLGVALMLSGHTHGGQIRLPGHGVIVRQSRYHLDEGHYRYGTSQLVVSRGIGVTGVPLRLACPPEGVLVQLRSGASRLGERLDSRSPTG